MSITTLQVNDKLEEIMCSNNFIKNLIFTNINYLNMRNNTFNKLIFNKSVTIDSHSLDFLLSDSDVNCNYIKLNNKKVDKIILTKHKSLIIEKTFLL